MSPSEAVELSAAGAHRRELILAEMRRAQRGRVRKRFVIRSGVALLIPAVAFVVVLRHGFANGVTRLFPNTPGSTEARSGSGEHGSRPTVDRPARFAMRHAGFEQVETDPALAERWAAHGDARLVVVIGDDELLDELRQIGRPTGMIRMAGHVEFTAQVARAPGGAGNGG